MDKSRECEEVVVVPDTGKNYKLAGTWQFAQRLNLNGRDLSLVYADLSEGQLNPDEIKNVIKFSLTQCDDKDLDDEGAEAAAVDIIEAGGIVEASWLARLMLSHIMVGRIKKKQIQMGETLHGIMEKFQRRLLISRWKVFALVGLLWVGPLIISIAALCMTFRI